MDAQDTDRHSNDDEYATPQLLPSTIDSTLAKLDDATSFSDEIKSKSHSARNLANHALEFFANASNETLTACFIGLGAATYLLLGRLGLILIGLVGGILVHAAWEETGGAQSGHESRADEARRRKKLGLEIANRVLDWREQKHDDDFASADPSSGHQRSSSSTRDLSNLAPETRAALESLTDAVIRDYVKWWYSPVLPADTAFPSACRRMLIDFIMAISNHLSRKRPADTFLDFVTHSSSIIIVFLNELSSSTAEAASNVSAADAVCSYIESNPDCSLASVMDRDHQRRKLKMVADDILHNFLDRRLNCEPVTVFLREILAGVILEMTIETCSKPEWINGWIVHLLEDGEPELMNAIDAGVTGKPHEGVIDSPISQQGDGDMFDSTSAGLERSHRRRMSKAEQAMQDAMLEAEKLNKMIADEDAARKDSLCDVPTPVPQHDVPEPEPEPEHLASANRLESSAFTSFDQLAPTSRPTALRSNGSNGSIPIATTPEKPTFTLHHANVSIFDDSTPTEKGVMRSKPTADYLIQIEPAASEYPGWMIARKYVDFLTLHEVLRRISVVSGVVGFKEQHGSLPNWKGQTKAFFRTNLERYLKDALSYRQLAESEGMKRFLEKERGLDRPNGGSAVKGGFPGIGWPSPASFETMGKGMLDALASAPKGAAGGGKAIIGGVTGVLGGAAAAAKNQRHPSVDVKNVVQPGGRRVSNGSLVRNDSTLSRASSDLRVRSSQEVAAHSPGGNDELTRQTSLHGHTASEEKGIDDALPKPVARTSLSSSSSSVDHVSADQSRATSALATSQSSLTSVDETKLNLPPLPSDIPDNYGSSTAHPHRPDAQTTSLDDVWTDAPIEGVSTPQVSPEPALNVSKPKMENAELSEEETRVAVELLFAVINELYTLSSAWNIRRTLLTAAKTFLLRPGNPSLEAIRVLLQDSVIEANTSDSGIASHIRTLEKNSLPAEDELKGWPSAPSQEEKGALRVKARQLLIERGMPQALTSVMGSAASGEALGRVFDCLQVDEVARGLMFGVILQALRAVTQ